MLITTCRSSFFRRDHNIYNQSTKGPLGKLLLITPETYGFVLCPMTWLWLGLIGGSGKVLSFQQPWTYFACWPAKDLGQVWAR